MGRRIVLFKEGFYEFKTYIVNSGATTKMFQKYKRYVEEGDGMELYKMLD